MKKLILILIIIVVVVGGGLTIYDKITENNLGGWFATSGILVGSSSNAVSLPRSAVFANNTTTAPSTEHGMADGGELVNQYVDTNDKDSVILNITAVGPTATSTIYIRQMGSHDGTNYFDLGTSTDFSLPPAASTTEATTTIATSPLAIQWIPGTATTTAPSITFDTKGYRHTRFIMWSEGWTGHLDTGVQAFITAVPVETKY